MEISDGQTERKDAPGKLRKSLLCQFLRCILLK
jgi:hypothetical protein